jgi:hypothetical protein
MAKKSTGHFLHIQPERVDYAVSEAELERLRKGEYLIWKDIFLVTVALAIPTLVNAIVETTSQAEFKVTLSILLNFLIGIVSFMFCIIAGVVWYQQQRDLTSVIETIRNKPRHEIPPGVFSVGTVRKDPEPPTSPSRQEPETK